MSFLLIANFKSHKTGPEITAWLQAVTPVAKTAKNVEVVVAPSFVYLSMISGPATISLAAQDVSPFPPGSYTGAVSAAQLKAIGIEYAIIGHSERRRYFHETYAEVGNKTRELVAASLTPILCLSRADIVPQLAALDDELKSKLILVYEPPENIGGTETAPANDIKSTLHLLHSLVPQARLLYGGSVHAGNVGQIQGIGAQGALVGTASLQSSDFIALIKRLE